MPHVTQQQQEASRRFGLTAPKSVCQCGHEGDGEGSDHSSSGVWSAGHGACTVPGCPCLRFRWMAFTDAYRNAVGVK